MLAQHPANLLLRFVLEVTSLVIAGQWAWRAAEGLGSAPRLLLTIAVPLLMAVLWGVFRVPGDPSPEKKPIVAVPGTARLVLELAFFGFALWAAFANGQTALALGFGFGLLLHHLWSVGRLAWLVRQ
jgi:hypothetical protein